MKRNVLTAVVVLILVSCGSPNQPNVSTKDSVATVVDSVKPTPNTQVVEKMDISLLQGKWQSNDDKSNFIVFENNHRKEIADGMDKWDDEEYVLSDKCKNDTNKDDEIESEPNRYISLMQSDMCWYIIELNATTLSLSYMGRGNTLNYTRVK